MNDTHPDPYAVLGVAPTATAQQINRAYRRLLRHHHPDTRSGEAMVADGSSGVSLADLLTAYALLRDPVTRAQHDRTRAAAPGPGAPPPREPRRAPSTVGREEGEAAVRVGMPSRVSARDAQEPEIRVGPVMWRPPR